MGKYWDKANAAIKPWIRITERFAMGNALYELYYPPEDHVECLRRYGSHDWVEIGFSPASFLSTPIKHYGCRRCSKRMNDYL